MGTLIVSLLARPLEWSRNACISWRRGIDGQGELCVETIAANLKAKGLVVDDKAAGEAVFWARWRHRRWP